MKKFILVSLICMQNVFAASVSETFIAPVEYKKLQVKFHHADCVSSIYISGTVVKTANCWADVRLPAGVNLQQSNMILTTAPSKRKITSNVAKYTLARTDLACSAEVTISPFGANWLRVFVKFTKLTNMTHPSVVMCSKRLIEKYSKGNPREMQFDFTAMVPAL